MILRLIYRWSLIECAGGILPKPGSSDYADTPSTKTMSQHGLFWGQVSSSLNVDNCLVFFSCVSVQNLSETVEAKSVRSHIWISLHFLHLFLVVLMKTRLSETSNHRGNFLYSSQQSRQRGKIIMTQKTLIQSNQSLHVLLAYWVTLSITGLTAGADGEVRCSVR